jgi:hypothetical protein
VKVVKLRKFIPMAVFALAYFLGLCSAYGQETWVTGGGSTWGAGSTSNVTLTAHTSQSGGSSTWAAGKGSFESRSQQGGIWHEGSAFAPAGNNVPRSSAAKSVLESGQSLSSVTSKLVSSPPASSPAIGKGQISHPSGGHSSSAKLHSPTGPRVGGRASSHGTQFRFSRSKNASSAATNAFGTGAKSGAGSGMDSLQRSENAIKEAENPSVSDSLKK